MDQLFFALVNFVDFKFLLIVKILEKVDLLHSFFGKFLLRSGFGEFCFLVEKGALVGGPDAINVAQTHPFSPSDGLFVYLVVLRLRIL